MITELNERTRQILKLVVDSYVETGEPVGSRTLAEKMGLKLSPATIRNAMADMEAKGLLYSPHTSAGRLPTEAGLSVFVEGLLELGEISSEDKTSIERQFDQNNTGTVSEILEQTGALLSGLSSCAGLVFAPKTESAIKQIDFVQLAPRRILVVLVSSSGLIENRLIELNEDIPSGALTEAANYLNGHLGGQTLAETIESVRKKLNEQRAQLDNLTARLVESGLASLLPDEQGGHLIVRGQGKLLEDITAVQDLERIRTLFDALETKETMLKLLSATTQGEGVQIFIGASNQLFNHAGCTMIVSPWRSADSRLIGALGIIGPSRMNYGRIIPVINYTSQLIGKVLK